MFVRAIVKFTYTITDQEFRGEGDSRDRSAFIDRTVNLCTMASMKTGESRTL